MTNTDNGKNTNKAEDCWLAMLTFWIASAQKLLQGIATMEDILEELVGEINDEYDEEQTMVQKKDEITFVVQAQGSLLNINRWLPYAIPLLSGLIKASELEKNSRFILNNNFAPMKILLIEDEPSVASLINRGLTENGYSLTVAPDGTIGYNMAMQYEFDVVILDIMLPGINGMEVCRQLRVAKITTPILFLTALGTTENIVAGLNAGGDDYLVKPFKFAELEARLKSLMRRKNLSAVDEDEKQHLDTLVVDFKSKQVTRDGEPISLTSTEFRLLEFFMRNKNRVVSRMEILEKVWGIDFNMGTNVVDVYVNYLRKKLDDHNDKKLIQTVVGMGYMLKV